jgi:uncharacterized protein (TIGR03435 family)
MAYFPRPLWSDQRIQGAPSWVNNYLYDIETRVAPEDLAAWQSKRQNFVSKEMLEDELQEMLKERCRLVAHMVPAHVDGYELQVSDRGDRLSRPARAASSSIGERMPLPYGGVATYISTDNSEYWAFSDTSIKDLIVFLSTRTSGVIIDKTGLTGRYNFELSGRNGADESASGDNPPVVWDFGPLGLKLKKAKIGTTTLVIDHIEQPSMN